MDTLKIIFDEAGWLVVAIVLLLAAWAMSQIDEDKNAND